jgi:N-acetyl-gamma-glutamyl-phosphate reductase
VVASNYATLSATVDGETVVVYSIIDNLIKGAAGGSMQWANRLLGFPESEGLLPPPAGWL